MNDSDWVDRFSDLMMRRLDNIDTDDPDPLMLKLWWDGLCRDVVMCYEYLGISHNEGYDASGIKFKAKEFTSARDARMLRLIAAVLSTMQDRLRPIFAVMLDALERGLPSPVLKQDMERMRQQLKVAVSSEVLHEVYGCDDSRGDG